MKIIIFGLSLTSSWGNGHATTYRALIRELAARGHRVLFLERDQPWYAENRDLHSPPYCRVELYQSLTELRERFAEEVRSADAVIVGSYVPEGVTVGAWVTSLAQGITAFYDIDTPVTLGKLESGEMDYLSPALVRRYQHYLSFTGGPMLDRIATTYRAPSVQALYCSVDPLLYYPEACELRWDLGYLGTYSEDRHLPMRDLLLEPARSLPRAGFVVAGSLYPPELTWPANVQRIAHLPPAGHRHFYNSQRFTLNLTRAAMVRAGYSPSVRLFEAAACGTPIISDVWPGLESMFKPHREILLVRSSAEVVEILHDLPEDERIAIGQRARRRVLEEHTAAHRAEQLEAILQSSTPVFS